MTVFGRYARRIVHGKRADVADTRIDLQRSFGSQRDHPVESNRARSEVRQRNSHADHLAAAHAGQMLNGTRDSRCDVQLRRDHLAGLADLPVVRRITRIDAPAPLNVVDLDSDRIFEYPWTAAASGSRCG